MEQSLFYLFNRHHIEYKYFDSVINFEHNKHHVSIYHNQNDSYTLKIDSSYFIIGEGIDVVDDMLTKLFNGESITATSKALHIRGIIFAHNRFF